MHYPGGKGKTFQHIINAMPPHRVYIETHLGGGAVIRNKKLAAINIGIDLDQRVIDNWRVENRSNIELIHGQAEQFISQYAFQGDELIYSDPPYHPQTRKQQRVYSHDYSIKDHERLITILKSLPCMVILSGYACPLYNKALPNWNTRIFRSKTHTDVREETIWFNFDPPEQLHDSRYLGNNFREREATKRRLQRLKNKFVQMDPAERATFSIWLNKTYPYSGWSN